MVDTQEPIFVIGHRNPDTDAICSAIGYADFLRQTGMPTATAACCGSVNPRTAWVLRYAGLDEPRLLGDLRPRALALCEKELVVAAKDETFLEVYQKMRTHGFRAIPVVDDHGKIVGMPTLLEILELLLPVGEMRSGARTIKSSIRNMTNSLDAALFATGPAIETEEDLFLLVGASSLETVKERMRRFPPHSLIVITGDRPRVQQMAVDAGVRCLIITGGFDPDPELLAKAGEQGVCIICCQHDTASTAQLIRCSRQVAGIIDRSFISFPEDALISDIVKAVRDTSQVLFPVVRKTSGRLLGVFSKSDLVDPKRPNLILVDHNEFSQAVPGADESNILSVVDHHRLSGDLVSRDPIRFINEPVGSTSTIIGTFYRQHQIKPPAPVAICLCAGIISDTLHLTSPTKTPVDEEVLAWLADVAQLDLVAFSNDFFATGSLLKNYSPREAIESDRKEFTEGPWKLCISQIEELGLDEFWKYKGELTEMLEEVRTANNLDFACLMVTDINENNSVLLTTAAKSVEDAIEYPKIGKRLYELNGVVSRKKQLFPYLSRILSRVTPENGTS
ncbi:MAG: manganese-dependent inorganic pyrophosphatase [Verrucomicrobiales bacterium]|jgi:manganese-dependent inorganic pyrophosphatase